MKKGPDCDQMWWSWNPWFTHFTRFRKGIWLHWMALFVSHHRFWVWRVNYTAEFAKLHMGLVVLVKILSVLINFLLQNTNLVSVLIKLCPNFAGHIWQGWQFREVWYSGLKFCVKILKAMCKIMGTCLNILRW